MNNPYGIGNSNPGNGYPQPGYTPPSAPAGHGPPSYSQPGYSQPGYVSYGQGAAPPNVYVPVSGAAPHELSGLKDDAQLWLLVGAAGFWFGFGFITGPLSWYFGSQIRGKYRALGHHPCSTANWAWGIGIATTALYVLGVMLIVAIAMFLIGATAIL